MILSQTIWENLLEFDVDGVLKPQLGKGAAGDIGRQARLQLRAARRRRLPERSEADGRGREVQFRVHARSQEQGLAAARIFDRLSHVEIDSPYRLRVILKEPYSPWVYFQTKHMGIWPNGIAP